MSLTHLHPMLVHFPIALALVAFLFNIVSYFLKKEWLRSSSVALTVLATLGAIAALLSGFFFTKPVAGLAATMKVEHITYGVASTILLFIAAIIGLVWMRDKKGGAKVGYLYTLFMLLAAIGISLTGMVGGSIVYDVWLF